MKNITKLEQNVYEIRFSYVDQLTGKRRRVRRRLEGTLTDAKAVRDKLRVQANEGSLQRNQGLESKPLSSWLGEYLDHRKRHVATSTYPHDPTHLLTALADRW